MTAPWRDEDDIEETVPVSELRRPNPFRDVPPVEAEDDAPMRMDVSIAVVLAACFGSVAASAADEWPGSTPIINLGAIALLLLLIRWTKKR